MKSWQKRNDVNIILAETTHNEYDLTFVHLPAYAKFIREQHLIEYIRHQLTGARKLKTPLLRFFEGLDDEELIKSSIADHETFLIAAEQNQLKNLLHESLEKWISDKLEIVRQHEIEAEDITQISYLRKKALLHFIPFYTTDLPTIFGLINEIDRYTLESDTLSTATYIRLLKDRIAAKSKAVKDREDQLLEAQNIARLGNFQWDLLRDKLDVSPQLLHILELEKATNFDDFLQKVHPQDQPKLRKAMERAYETGKYECEYRLISKTSSNKVIWSRGIVTFSDKKPSFFRGTVMDITEKQQIIQRLRRSEALYKQAQTLSHIGNWTWEIASNLVTWSEELYNIFGLSDLKEQITFEKYLKLIHPEDKDFLVTHVQQCLKTGKSYDFYHRIITPQGMLKYIQSRGEVVLNEDNEPVRLMGTAQDVTRQQLTERELRNSQAFIRRIADTTPSLITVQEVATGRFTFINKALHTMLGYNETRIAQADLAFFESIIHPEDLPLFRQRNEQVRQDQPPAANHEETVVDFKYRIRKSDEEYLWFHTYTTVFSRHSNEMVKEVLAVSIDVTNQELAEQNLQQKNIQLEQSNTSLEEYAYVASHDLKEPLRKIATFSDRLLSGHSDQLDENGKIYLQKIMDSSRRMQNMIGDLLAVSVISGNKAYVWQSLEALLEDAKQTLEYKIEEKQATIHSDGLPFAFVVPSQFRQLFLNLLSNSLKFAREGVPPVIRVSHRYRKPDEIRHLKLSKVTRCMEIRFEDNGIGFDNQFANKIFSIFQRLHGRSEYEGTGIGLAICRKVTENHDGTITAEGDLNKGATFIVSIPAEEDGH